MWHIHWHMAFFGAMYLVLIQLQYCDPVFEIYKTIQSKDYSKNQYSTHT